jgi:phosphoribosyl 1,2-cyclic phosphate phosphodiesterase
VQDGETAITIDIGPDFRQQMLRHCVDHLDAVLLTHEHNDHVIGLDDIRPFNFTQKRDMPIYGTKRVHSELERRFYYIFDDVEYPGRPQIRYVEIDKDSDFEVGNLHIECLEVFHGKLPVLGFRIGDFCYITDAKTIPACEMDKIRNLDLLVINALHHRVHHAHLNLREAIELVRTIQPKRAYFTHISHFMGRYEDVASQLPANIYLAHDGLTFDL